MPTTVETRQSGSITWELRTTTGTARHNGKCRTCKRVHSILVEQAVRGQVSVEQGARLRVLVRWQEPRGRVGMIIVIAWTEPGAEWDDKPYRRDLGERPGMVDTVVPRAVVWLLEGTSADLEHSRDHAATLGGTVYTFPVRHPDPLGRARAMVVGSSAECLGVDAFVRREE